VEERLEGRRYHAFEFIIYIVAAILYFDLMRDGRPGRYQAAMLCLLIVGPPTQGAKWFLGRSLSLSRQSLLNRPCQSLSLEQ